jgi:predicted NBD/HSP70 family sugar kinase
MVRGLLATPGVDAARLVGVGVSLPNALGQTDLPTHHPRGEWVGLDVADLFSQALSGPLGRAPSVVVENDAAAAALGELQFGLGLNYSSFFYTLVSAGLGGGLVVEGDYFRGANGFSGEIGFVPIHSPTFPTRPLQDLVSLSALIAYLAESGVKVSAPSELAALDSHGQALLTRWIETAAELLTEPLMTVSWLINPAAILIGGRLPLPMLDDLAERLTENLRQRRGAAPTPLPEVRRAAMAEDAPAVGAAILPFLLNLLPSKASLFKVSD